MRDVIDQITKLLALAESPAEEEARSAAMQAVRLIKKHKIELRMPGVGTATSTSVRGVPRDSSISDFLAMWMMNNNTPPVPYTPRHAPPPHAPPRHPPPYAPPVSDPAPPKPTPPPKKKSPTAKPISMVSQFDGKCPHCKLWFHAGDEILWMKRRGATHAKCEAYWKEKE